MLVDACIHMCSIHVVGGILRGYLCVVSRTTVSQEQYQSNFPLFTDHTYDCGSECGDSRVFPGWCLRLPTTSVASYALLRYDTVVHVVVVVEILMMLAESIGPTDQLETVLTAEMSALNRGERGIR